MGNCNIKVGIIGLKRAEANFLLWNEDHDLVLSPSAITSYNGHMDDVNEAMKMIRRGGLPRSHIWRSIGLLLEANIKQIFGYEFLQPARNQYRCWNEAEVTYKKIHKNFLKHFGENSCWVGKTVLNWGTILKKTRGGIVSRADLKRSEDLINQGIFILKKFFLRNNHRDVVAGQLALAWNKYNAKSYDVAEEISVECEEIILTYYGRDDPLLRATYKTLEYVFKGMVERNDETLNYAEHQLDVYTNKLTSWNTLRGNKILQDDIDYEDNWSNGHMRWPLILQLGPTLDRHQPNCPDFHVYLMSQINDIL